MTWVVAASTLFGYGALYSDVQVTLRDGTTRDLVQKAYPVANFIACGFAGSVKIGFMLVQSLMDHLRMPEEAVHRYAWEPPHIAHTWAPIAHAVFASAEKQERKLGSRLLLVGASPTEMGALGAKIYFVRYSSPAFQPQIMSRPVKICGIGTGAAVREYKHIIKPLFRLTSGILQAEVGVEGGWGATLAHSLSRTLTHHPYAGISPHFNTILIARGGFRFGNTDKNVYYPDGRKEEDKMPPVAKSYDEFLQLVNATGANSAYAVC